MRATVWVLSACIAVWGAAASPTGVAAQSNGRSTITGMVRDSEGRAIPRVQVTIITAGRSTLADAAGRFTLRGIPVGSHRLEASLIGYAPVRRQVEVSMGAASGVLEIVLNATPLSLPGIQVTANPTNEDPLAVAQATTQLGGKALERELAGTIARTLESQPGIAVRYNGPSAAVPVIRGLTGDRILMLQDGQRTADLAGSAEDHAVTIDPLNAKGSKWSAAPRP